MVLFDWQRGRIPWFQPPPFSLSLPSSSLAASDPSTLPSLSSSEQKTTTKDIETGSDTEDIEEPEELVHVCCNFFFESLSNIFTSVVRTMVVPSNYANFSCYLWLEFGYCRFFLIFIFHFGY